MNWFKKKGFEETEKSEEAKEGNSQEYDMLNEGMAISPKLPALPPLPKLPKFDFEEPENTSSIKNIVSQPPMQLDAPYSEGVQTSQMPSYLSPAAKEAEPIFVKIDRFKEASEDFKRVKEKITEIEDMLKKIHELRKGEDSELEAWEKEIQTIKSRMDSIDNSLFKRIGE